MATWMRCRAQLTLSGSWGSEHLWPGLEVNFARELAPGFTVADAVAGREDCFEPVAPAQPVAPRTLEAAPAPLDTPNAGAEETR